MVRGTHSTDLFLPLNPDAETSAHTLTFTLALLAIHPEVQEKLFQETKNLWPDLDGDAVRAI
jgi:cytochrome P450